MIYEEMISLIMSKTAKIHAMLEVKYGLDTETNKEFDFVYALLERLRKLLNKDTPLKELNELLELRDEASEISNE
jgi:hypothetical protein